MYPHTEKFREPHTKYAVHITTDYVFIPTVPTLAVHLRVLSCITAKANMKELCQPIPIVRDKPWVFVRDNGYWNTMLTKISGPRKAVPLFLQRLSS